METRGRLFHRQTQARPSTTCCEALPVARHLIAGRSAPITTTDYQTLIEHWDGVTWTIVNSPNTSSTQYNYLLGVTCAAASECWATGYYSNDSGVPQTLIQRWNGTSWTIVDSPNTDASQENILYSVACAETSNCWAVGSAINATT